MLDDNQLYIIIKTYNYDEDKFKPEQNQSEEAIFQNRIYPASYSIINDS